MWVTLPGYGTDDSEIVLRAQEVDRIYYPGVQEPPYFCAGKIPHSHVWTKPPLPRYYCIPLTPGEILALLPRDREGDVSPPCPARQVPNEKTSAG